MKTSKISTHQSCLRKYTSNISGGFAIWAALTLPLLVGGVALSVDTSRAYNLDQELQSAADALARAGAAELDQRPDSITRANRAITNLVSNSQKFGNEGFRRVQAQRIRYLKYLPANDYDLVTSDMVTTEPSKAKYTEILVVPETVSMIFPQGVVKSVASITLQAESIAGFGQGVCGVAPIFVCNPFEGTDTSIYTAMGTASFRRRLVQFKSPKNKYGPGNFGFLDPYGGGSGASVITDATGRDKPDICFSQSQGVALRPGNISSVRFGFNTRFDIYEGSFKNKKTDPAFAPSPNVVKGYSGGACNGSPDDDALALPLDDCFNSDSCTLMDGRQGNGNWDFVSYMEINHNAANLVTIAGTTYTFDYSLRTSTPSSPPSRYDVYRWEIDTGSIPGDLSYGTSSTPEEGTPQCHSSGASSANIDRRILYAAVLNCAEIEATIGMNGRTSGLPVEIFAKVFITRPMGTGKDNIIWGEIVGPVVAGIDSVAKDQVDVAR